MAVFMTVQLFQKRETEGGSTNIFPKLALFIANSSDGAQRKSLAKLLEEYPPAKGYFNHAVMLGEIPREVLERLASSARLEKEVAFINKIQSYTILS